MPEKYFAIGTTLAGMVNVETYTPNMPPTVLPDLHAPAMGGVRRQLASGRVRRDGFRDGAWLWDVLRWSDWRALVLAAFGTYSLVSRELFVTTIDSAGFYSPYLCFVEQAHIGENRRAFNELWQQEVRVGLVNLRLQSVTKTASATLTTSERLTLADSTSGNVTLTLPAAAAVTAETVYSIVKAASANNVVIDPNGAELIDGALTKTLTALNQRVDIVSDGAAWRTVGAS